MASLSALPAGAAAAALWPVSSASSTLSRSSSTSRCAVFLPMPGTRVSAAASPATNAMERSLSGMEERMDSAMRGPTPLTERNRSNMRFSSRL